MKDPRDKTSDKAIAAQSGPANTSGHSEVEHDKTASVEKIGKPHLDSKLDSKPVSKIDNKPVTRHDLTTNPIGQVVDQVTKAINKAQKDVGDLTNAALNTVTQNDVGKQFADNVSPELARDYQKGKSLVEQRQSQGRQPFDLTGLSADETRQVEAYRKLHSELPAKIPFYNQEALSRQIDLALAQKTKVPPPQAVAQSKAPVTPASQSKAESRVPQAAPAVSSVPKDAIRATAKSETRTEAKPDARVEAKTTKEEAPKSQAGTRIESRSSNAGPGTGNEQTPTAKSGTRQDDRSEVRGNVKAEMRTAADSGQKTEPLAAAKSERKAESQETTREPISVARSVKAESTGDDGAKLSNAGRDAVGKTDMVKAQYTVKLSEVPAGLKVNAPARPLEQTGSSRPLDQSGAAKTGSTSKHNQQDTSVAPKRSEVAESRKVETREVETKVVRPGAIKSTNIESLTGALPLPKPGDKISPVQSQSLNERSTTVGDRQTMTKNCHRGLDLSAPEFARDLGRYRTYVLLGRDNALPIVSNLKPESVVRHALLIQPQFGIQIIRLAPTTVAPPSTVEAPVVHPEPGPVSSNLDLMPIRKNDVVSNGRPMETNRLHPQESAPPSAAQTRANQSYNTPDLSPSRPSVSQSAAGAESIAASEQKIAKSEPEPVTTSDTRVHTVRDLKYITGAELVFAVIVAVAGTARARGPEHQIEPVRLEATLNETEAEQLATSQDVAQLVLDSSAASAMHTKRPEIIIALDDTLVEIAARQYGESSIGWLIVALNPQCHCLYRQNNCLVKLKVRQTIVLPLFDDLKTFARQRKSYMVAANLLTVVEDTAVNKEVLNQTFAGMLGLDSLSTDPLQKVKEPKHN